MGAGPTAPPDLARGQLLRRLGSLRQAGAGPTDATGRLLRHIGPHRHPFDNRPVPIPSCEPRDRFSPTAAICTARHEAISPSARTISSSPLNLGQLPPIHTRQPTNRLGQEILGPGLNGDRSLADRGTRRPHPPLHRRGFRAGRKPLPIPRAESGRSRARSPPR